MALGKKWYQLGLCFECAQCGNCCSGEPGYVWATKEEVRRVSKFLGRTDGWLDPKHIRRIGFRYSFTEKPNGDCIFLKRERGESMCSIYPVRPLQCRTWPFWSSVLNGPDTWNEAVKKCPGMNRGERYDLDRIEEIRTRKKW